MSQDHEPDIQAYTALVRSAEFLHTEVARGLMIEGFTASQFSAMNALRLHGRLSQRDIAKFILKTDGNTTAVVDNLEKAGLVVRDRDTEDRRVIYVSLTDYGKTAFDRLNPGHLQRIREAMAGLTADEYLQLKTLIQKLAPKPAVAAR
jgi:DNA-binding MarR family transcriptional regulator